MNSDHFEHPSSNDDYPLIKLDMTDFTVHKSEEYISRKIYVNDDSVQTNPTIIDCKTEDCTDLGEISSVSEGGLKQEEKVRYSLQKVCVIAKQFD